MTVASSSPPRLGTTRVFVTCFAIELLVFAILPLSSLFGVRPLLPVQASISAALLVASLLERRTEWRRSRADVLYAFFVGSTTVLVSRFLDGRLLEGLPVVPVSPAWIALSKVSEAAWRVATIVLLVAGSGASLRSVYLARGRLGLGLGVGFAGFAACAGAAFVPLVSRQGGWDKLVPLAPWILTFVLANGFAEELLFRGLFLQRLERLLGRALSNVMAATAYTALHVQATGVSELVVVPPLLFALGLGCGWLMQKTGSIWGAALLHAGADCLVIFAIQARV